MNLTTNRMPIKAKEKKSKPNRTCQVCNKTFTRMARLRIHERIHVRDALIK